MARILKNKTDNDLKLTDQSPGITVSANSQSDLSEWWQPWQLAGSNQLLDALGLGTDSYQLNDGTNDLTVAQAVDLIRGFYQALPLSGYNRLQVENSKPSGTGLINVSHDFTKPCSWYQNSTKVENEELTNPKDDGILWRSNYKWWIDLYHGFIAREGNFNSTYKVKIEVNLNSVGWVEKTEGIDFLVDYACGEVKTAWHNPFLSDCEYADPENPPPMLGMGALDPDTDKLRATYYHANGAGSSCWTLTPTAGKIRRIERTEVQFTQDVLLHSAIVFCPYITNPQDPDGPKVPIMSELAVYKGARDFIAEGNEGTGTIQPFGGGGGRDGTTVRGLRHGCSVFPFDYLTTKDLKSSLGMELRVWSLNDLPVEGEYGNVTCYCLEQDDPDWTE